MTLEVQQEATVNPEPTTNEADQAQVEQVTETTPTDEPQAAAPSDDDAAFQAGFDAADGKAAPEPEPAKAEPEPVRFAGFTEAEIKEMAEQVKTMSGQNAKVFGTLGSLRQQMEALRNQPAAQPSQALKLTKDTLKRLSAEFPELAEALVEDLGSLQVGQEQTTNPDEIARLARSVVSEELEAANRNYERRLLAVKHPDWKAVANTPEFVAWIDTNLPPEEQEVIRTTWDADFLGDKLTQFKDWKSKAVQIKQEKQQRLENAVTPRGNATRQPTASPEDEFIKGFNSLGPVGR